MATNTWISGSSTDGNLGSNWSLGVLSATDDLSFDASSSVNCTFTAPVTCNTFTVANTYTKNVNDGGFAFTIASTVSVTPNASTVITCSGTWTQTGDANFILNIGGTYSIGSMGIVLQGTGNFTLAPSYVYIASLTCANTGKTTTLSAMSIYSGIRGASTMLTTGTGLFALNGNSIQFFITGTCTPYVVNGTVTGNSTIAWFIHWIGTSANGIVTLNTLNCGNAQFDPYIDGSATKSVTWNLAGNIACGMVYMVEVASATSTGNIFNTNNYSITNSGAFVIGTNVVNTNLTFNGGSSTISCSSFSSASYNTGITNFNMQTSVWTVGGNWTNGSLCSITAGTSAIAINATCALTCAAQILFNISITSGTVTLQDAFSCNTLTISGTSTSFNQNTKAITLASDFSWSGTGTLTLNTTLTITGDGTFTIANAGTITTSNCVLTPQGTGAITINKATTLRWISCAYTGKTTTIAGTASLTVGHTSDSLVFNGGAFVNNNAAFNITPISTQNFYSGTVTSWIGTGTTILNCGAITCSVPASTITQASVSLKGTASTGPGTINIQGNLSITGNLYLQMSGAGQTVTWNSTDGLTHSISGTLYLGATVSGTTAAYAFGTASWSAAAFDGSTATGISTFASTGNFTVAGAVNWTSNASSSFTASGIWTQTGDANFTLANTGTYSVASMQVVLQGTGTLSIAKASTTIAKLTCAATGKTTTMGTIGVTSGILSGSDGMLTCGSGTLALGGVSMPLYVTAACTPYSFTSTSVTSTGGACWFSIASKLTVDGTITIPAITITGGTAGISLWTTTGCSAVTTFSITGALSFSGASYFYIDTGTTGTGHVFNINDNSLATSGIFYIGSNVTGKTLTVNFGSSAITCGGFNTTTYNTGATAINWQTSTITCSGNWSYGSNTTPDANGTFIFTNTSSITSASKSFNILRLSATGKTITAADNLAAARLQITPAITLSLAGSLTLTSYTDGDIYGNTTHVLIKSTVGASQRSFVNPTGMLLMDYVDFTDINATNATTTVGTVSNCVNITAVAAATRTWSSSSSTDGSNVVNYSGSGAFRISDIVVFSNTSVVNCTLTAAIIIGTFTINSTYTGTFNDGGYAVTTNGAISVTAGYTFTASGAWTIIGDANFTIANSGSANTASMILDLKGTGTYSNSKSTIAKLICAYTGKTTTFGTIGASIGLSGSGTGLLTCGSGTLAVGGANFWIYMTATSTPYSFNGTTVSGSGFIQCAAINTSSATITIPAITTAATITLRQESGNTADVTWNITGTISCASFYMIHYAGSGTGHIYNTNNNSVTASGTVYLGSATAAKAVTYNLGSSAMTCAGLDFSTYNTGTSTFNMQTSTTTCSGTWTLASNVTVNAGTSLLTLSSGGTLTLAGKTVYDITVNGTYTVSGSVNCHNINVTAGSFNAGSNAVNLSGLFTWSAAGTLTFSGTVTMTGDANFTINNSGTITTSSCVLVVQGTGAITINKATTLRWISCAYTGKTTTINGAAALSIGHTDTSLVFNGGNLINDNTSFTVSPQLSAAFYSGSVTWTGIGTTILNCGAITCSVAATTVAQAAFYLRTSSGTGSGTINITGTLNVTATNIYLNNTNTQAGIINTNNNTISLNGIVNIGSTNVTGSLTFNMGSSVISFNSLNNLTTYNTGASTFAFSTASLTLSGDCAFGSNATITNTSSILTFTTNNANITSAGKTLPALVFNGDTKTYTPQDAITCASLTHTAGNFNQNSKAMTVTGNVAINSGGTNTLNATWTVGGDWTWGASSVATITSMSISLSKNGAVLTTNAKALPQITFTNNGTLNGGGTIARLILTSAKTYTMLASSSWTITSYTSGDWDGVLFVSSSPGTYYSFTNPAGMVVHNVSFADFHASNQIDALDHGVNNGDNINILFAGTAAIILAILASQRIGCV